MECEPTLKGALRNQSHHTKNVQNQVNPSPNNQIDEDGQDGQGQEQLTQPTTIDLITHGYHLVEIEKIWYGRKTLAWHLQYRNRDGFLLSLL